MKGRAALTLRFHTVTIGSRSYDIAAEPIRREAEGTKKKDARDIGIGAGAGAVIGGIIGGGKGAGHRCAASAAAPARPRSSSPRALKSGCRRAPS